MRGNPQFTFFCECETLALLRHAHLGSFFWGPEGIKILGNVVMRGNPQFTFFCECETLALLRHAHLGSFLGP